MADLELFDGLAVVMAHPDDEVLWASSVLRQARRIILSYGDLPCDPSLLPARRAAMQAFPLETLDWLEMVETGIFDSASWPNPLETDYGVKVHPSLKMLPCFDAVGYRDQFNCLRDRLASRLDGSRNVIVHSPWGEYGHEDHVQHFRVVCSLREELGLKIWVPAYYANKSETLMRRSLVYFGAPTSALATDRALADELRALYQRTGCWTWFDGYTWPEEERFLPFIPNAGQGAGKANPTDLQRIVFPAAHDFRTPGLRGLVREAGRTMMSWRHQLMQAQNSR